LHKQEIKLFKTLMSKSHETKKSKFIKNRIKKKANVQLSHNIISQDKRTKLQKNHKYFKT